MAIDNKLDAIETLIAKDRRAETSTVVQVVLQGLGKIPIVAELTGVRHGLAVIGQRHEHRRKENQELMLRTLWEETRRIAEENGDLKKESGDYVSTADFEKLFDEACIKSADLTDKKRVERISKILAHAIKVGPMTSVERIEHKHHQHPATISTRPWNLPHL